MSKKRLFAGLAVAALMCTTLVLPATASAHETTHQNRGDHPAYRADFGHRDDHDRRGHKHMYKARHHWLKHHRHQRDRHDGRHHELHRHQRHDHGFEHSGLRIFLGYWDQL